MYRTPTDAVDIFRPIKAFTSSETLTQARVPAGVPAVVYRSFLTTTPGKGRGSGY
jgi:hypothetical protein